MKKVFINLKGGDGTVYTVGFKSNRSYIKDLMFNLWCIVSELRSHWHSYRLAKKSKTKTNI